jgi:hypothetical protein
MRNQAAFAVLLLAILPVAATAETQEEQQACMNDAFSVCGDAIPDRDLVATCLARNISRLSPACRTVMLRYQTPVAPVAVATPPKTIKPNRAPPPSQKVVARQTASTRAQPQPGPPLRITPDQHTINRF